MQNFADSIKRSSEYLTNNFSQSIDSMVVLGSGLSNLSLEGYTLEKVVDYKSVPGLPEPTAPSHLGELRLYKGQARNGEIKNIAVCAGRFHLYEGYFGMRFPDMSEAYSDRLLDSAMSAAGEQGINYHKGVYAGVTGPSLETSAERRMLRLLGADAVGMSTVTEVIAAKHCAMDVLGLSAITNLALGDSEQQPDTIEEVLENAGIAGRLISQVIEGVLT